MSLQVEDIIDTGATLKAVIAKLEDLGAASVKSAVLLNKEERRNVVIEPDYAALKVCFLLRLGSNGDCRRLQGQIPCLSWVYSCLHPTLSPVCPAMSLPVSGTQA